MEMAFAEDADISNLDVLRLPSEFACAAQIVEFISYRELNLARLVEEILIAQGYRTQASPFGDAGCVYVLAKGGNGPFGFVLPCIAVLVTPIHQMDDPAIDELKSFKALSGAANALFVSWLYFSDEAKGVAGRLFNQTEFWNVGRLIDSLEANYDKMPKYLKSYLPLKRIWILDREKQ